MIIDIIMPLYLGLLISVLSANGERTEGCFCIDDGLGSYVHCEISNQACVDQTVAPYLQDLPQGSFGELDLICDENEAIIFPNPLVDKATFTSLNVRCGLSVMEPGTLGNAEATIIHATMRLKQVPALQATRMVDLAIHGPNSLTLTNDTFVGYHSLQNLHFYEYSFIDTVEFGTFSVLPNLQWLDVAGPCIVYELGPGSLYFNPGSLQKVNIYEVEKILPGAISGIPSHVPLEITKLRNSDFSIEIFGGLLYGGSRLTVEAPVDNCKCSAAWIVRDNTSMALNSGSGAGASIMCFDFPWPNWGPARLSWLTSEDFVDCP